MMNNEELSSEDFQLHAASWCVDEAVKTISDYQACKTEHAKKRLLPKLKYLQGKLSFEGKKLGEMLNS